MESAVKLDSFRPLESDIILHETIMIKKSENTELNAPKEVCAPDLIQNETLVSEHAPVVKTIVKKLWYNHPLIPARIALSLWYGAARIPGAFLSVFMNQRGFSIVQFSTIFSMTFVFQFLCASLSGIVADKIGNAKPVLLFHILTTAIVILCMLLSPNVNSTSCVENDLLCPDDFKIFKNISSNMNFICYENYTDSSQFRGLLQTIDETRYNFNKTSVLPLCGLSNQDDEFVNTTNCFSILNSTFCDEIQGNYSTLCHNLFNDFCRLDEKKYHIIYAVLILFLFTFMSTAYRFMDVMLMCAVKKHGSNFGTERVMALIGELFIAILISFVLDTSTATGEKNNYDSVYWASAGVMFLAFLSVFSISDQISPPGRNLMKNSFKLLRDIDVMAFLAVVFIIGNGYAFNINFGFLYLEQLNAPKLLYGLHIVSVCLYGIPLLLTSKWWFKKIYPSRMPVLSLLCYAINAISYSFLYNPWLSLIIEWTTAIAYHLFWAAVVIQSHNIAPKGLKATVVAVTGAVHYGIARSTGIGCGGFLISKFGQRTTYRILATFFFVTAILYSIFLYKRSTSSVKGSQAEDKEVDGVKNLRDDDDAQEAKL